MTIEIEAPDGSVVEFPDGTPPAVMKQAMQRRYGAPSPSQQRANADAQRRADAAPGWMRAIGQGAAFNFGDEMDAAMARGETMFTNARHRLLGEQIPYTSQQAHDAVLQANRTAEERYAKEHPGQNLGFQIVGGLAVPGAPAKFVGRGATVGGKVARAALVGAAGGAVAGAGAAKGGVSERAKGAAGGAAIGAAVGGALPVAAAGVKQAARVVQRTRGGAAAARQAERTAEDIIAETLSAGRVDPQARATEWQAAQSSAPRLLDLLDENGRARIRALASQPGPGRDRAVQYAEEVAGNLQDNAINRTRMLTPDNPATGPELAQALATRIESAATPPEASNGYAGQLVSQRLNAVRDAGSARVSQAYNAAREAAPDAAILPNSERPALAATLRDAVRDFPIRDLTRVGGVLNDIDGLSTTTVRDLFDARSRLTNLRMSQDPVEATAAARLVQALDGAIDDASERGVITGDPSVVDLWRTAIANRRTFGQLWEGDDLIARVTERTNRGGQSNVNAVAPEDVSNAIFGRTGVSNRPDQVRDLLRLRDRLGEESPEWRAIQQEAGARLLGPEAGRETYGQAVTRFEQQSPELADILLSQGQRQSVTDAQAQIAAALAERQGLETGSRVMSISPDQWRAALAGADDTARGTARVGARQALVDALGGVAEGSTGNMNRIATSTNIGQNLEGAFGADEASRYRQALSQEMQRMSNARFISPNTGSQTELRSADRQIASALLRPIRALQEKIAAGVTLSPEERAAAIDLALLPVDQVTMRLSGRRDPFQDAAARAVLPTAAAFAN